jgi:hypothetical protein
MVQGNLLPPFSMWKQLFSLSSALKMEAAGCIYQTAWCNISHKTVILIPTDMTTLLIMYCNSLAHNESQIHVIEILYILVKTLITRCCD